MICFFDDPTIHMVGNQSLLYTLQYTSCDIFCNCTNVDPVCKHFQFILQISGLPSSCTKLMPYPIEWIIRQLHNTDMLEYKLDSITSFICMASLTMNCNICNKRIIKDYLMCDKCNCVSHLTCTKCKKNQQYSQSHMRHHMFNMYCTKHKTHYPHPLTSTSTQICYLCKRPWTPMKIPVKNKYDSLHDLLKSKG